MKLRSDKAFCFISLLDFAARLSHIGSSIWNFIGLDESNSFDFDQNIHESIKLYKSLSSTKIVFSS